jgi:hypothetical protein
MLSVPFTKEVQRIIKRYECDSNNKCDLHFFIAREIKLYGIDESFVLIRSGLSVSRLTPSGLMKALNNKSRAVTWREFLQDTLRELIFYEIKTASRRH